MESKSAHKSFECRSIVYILLIHFLNSTRYQYLITVSFRPPVVKLSDSQREGIQCAQTGGSPKDNYSCDIVLTKR